MPPRLSPETYDLDIVDQAFGRDADLYTDVLRVSYLASDSEIQSAFFDRRSEIFAVLSNLSEDNEDQDEIALSQRRFAERRMDAVVMAFRVLKDPELRAIYEGDRERRLSRRKARKASMQVSEPLTQSQSKDSMTSPTAVQSFDEYVRTMPSHDEVSPRRSRKSKKKSSKRIPPEPISPRQVNKSMDTDPTFNESASELSSRLSSYSSGNSYSREKRNDYETAIELYDDYEEVPRRSRGSDGVLAKIRESNLVRTIAEEVHGAYLDTFSAFDQVFNAFTLQENEIEAVCGRIEKAKRQLSNKPVAS